MPKASPSPAALSIAVRVYPDLRPTQPERKAPQIDGMLVFDCETRINKTQALTFGSYRFLRKSTTSEPFTVHDAYEVLEFGSNAGVWDFDEGYNFNGDAVGS